MSVVPVYDLELDLLFQVPVVKITGLVTTMVRPRWQADPPPQPNPPADWCAIGVTTLNPDAGPYLGNDPHDDTGIVSIRHERIEVLASFYGAHGQANAAAMRDGIAIPQNMEALEAQQIGLVETGAIRNVSYLYNMKWTRVYDLPLSFNRRVQRSYGIGRFAPAGGIHLIDDTFLDAVIPIPPGSPNT